MNGPPPPPSRRQRVCPRPRFFAVFANKEALLLKLTKWMYEKQFAVTHELLGKDYDPVMFYAVEPAIQLYIAEKTEGLRELYVSSYSYAATANYIHRW